MFLSPFSYRRTGYILLLLCGLLLVSVWPVSATPVPVDPVNDPSIWSLSDTWRVTAIESAVPSPSGRDIAYVVKRPVTGPATSEFRTTVYTVQADGSGTRQLTGNAYSASAPAWSPDGTQIAYLSDESGTPQIWVAGREGSGAYRLTTQETAISAFSWSPDGKQISYTALIPPSAEQKRAAAAKEDTIVSGENLPQIGLYLVPVVRQGWGFPDARLLTNAGESVSSWDWLPDGSGIIFIRIPAAEERSVTNTTIRSIRISDGAQTVLVPETGTHASYGQVLVSPDGRSVAFTTVKLFNLVDLSTVPVSGGAPHTVAADIDQGAAILLGIPGWSADGTAIYLPESKGTRVAVTAIPVDGSAPRELFRCGSITGLKENSWRTVFVYIAQDSLAPPEVYITPTDRYVPFPVTRLNADLPVGKIGKTEVIRWNSTDGKVIEGLLTYPANYTPGTKYPLIIEAHGGPSANFQQTFAGGTGWPILPTGTFSSLGYAILRPNVRGSTGYGADFTRANYADWGGGDFRDLMAGADHLVGTGIADPGRIGIIGQSYGGYMAAWSVTQTPRFRGAIVIDGITDLVSNVGTNDIPFDEPDNFGGEYWQKWDLYTSRSPVRHVANISTPTLVVTGQNDARVPPGQSQEFATALWKRGVPSQLVTYPRAGHFPSEPKQIQDLWIREIDWMNRYVNNAP